MTTKQVQVKLHTFLAVKH